MIKILIIDDNAVFRHSIRLLCDDLNKDDTVVYYGNSLYDADAYLVEEGVDFNLIILDLDTGDYLFGNQRYQIEYEALGNMKECLAGWIWIKQFLESNPKYNPKNIIILSAYTWLLKHDELEKYGVQVIEKASTESFTQLQKVILNAVNKARISSNTTETTNMQIGNNNQKTIGIAPVPHQDVKKAVPLKSVFLSYSWDDQEHEEWVKKFSLDLCEGNKIKTILDVKDLVLGDHIPHFMEQSIVNSDYVVIICTPIYKKKADKRTGGVGYEDSIITGELYNKNNQRKYIPVLARGSWTESIPTWAIGKLGVDLTTPENYREGIIKLRETISKGKM